MRVAVIIETDYREHEDGPILGKFVVFTDLTLIVDTIVH